jgi:hypothetical protein
VTAKAIRSEIGNESHTPSTPILAGNHINNGIRKITCLARLRNIAFHGEPILWKRHVEIIGNPTTENAHKEWCRQLTVTSIR